MRMELRKFHPRCGKSLRMEVYDKNSLAIANAMAWGTQGGTVSGTSRNCPSGTNRDCPCQWHKGDPSPGQISSRPWDKPAFFCLIPLEASRFVPLRGSFLGRLSRKSRQKNVYLLYVYCFLSSLAEFRTGSVQTVSEE